MFPLYPSRGMRAYLFLTATMDYDVCSMFNREVEREVTTSSSLQVVVQLRDIRLDIPTFRTCLSYGGYVLTHRVKNLGKIAKNHSFEILAFYSHSVAFRSINPHRLFSLLKSTHQKQLPLIHLKILLNTLHRMQMQSLYFLVGQTSGSL